MKRFDWQNFSDYLNIPIAYRFLDHAEVIPGNKATGVKLTSSLDWYFGVHFPRDPIMPGTFFVETLRQLGMLLINVTDDTPRGEAELCSCEYLRIYRPVHPGECLTISVSLDTRIDGNAHFSGAIFRSMGLCQAEEKVCDARFTLASSDRDWNFITEESRTLPHWEGSVAIKPENMGDYILNPPEYRFVDLAEAIPGVEAWGRKNVSSKNSHPYDPCTLYTYMPQICTMEAIMQTCIFTLTTLSEVMARGLMFSSCKNVNFYRHVSPGEQLKVYAKLDRFRRGIAVGTGSAGVNGARVCDMTFTLVEPNSMIRAQHID